MTVEAFRVPRLGAQARENYGLQVSSLPPSWKVTLPPEHAMLSTCGKLEAAMVPLQMPSHELWHSVVQVGVACAVQLALHDDCSPTGRNPGPSLPFAPHARASMESTEANKTDLMAYLMGVVCRWARGSSSYPERPPKT